MLIFIHPWDLSIGGCTMGLTAPNRHPDLALGTVRSPAGGDRSRTMSQDKTDGVGFRQRQHRDVQLHGHAVGCVNMQAALWAEGGRGGTWLGALSDTHADTRRRTQTHAHADTDTHTQTHTLLATSYHILVPGCGITFAAPGFLQQPPLAALVEGDDRLHRAVCGVTAGISMNPRPAR